jgi:proton glutamate symport protein
VSLGLVIVNVIQPGKSFSEETRILLAEQNKTAVNAKIAMAEETKSQSPLTANDRYGAAKPY